MRAAAFLFLALVAGGLAWIRLAPSRAADWHVDPLTAAAPGAGGWLVRPEGGDAPAPVLPVTPTALLEALDTVALATPRTRRLAGSPADGRITYVTRSRVLGFPDYTTVTAVKVDGGSAPAILARLRFGRGDLGVNRARAEDWLRRLDARLGTGRAGAPTGWDPGGPTG